MSKNVIYKINLIVLYICLNGITMIHAQILKKCAFFDRDDTLIKDVPYRASLDDPIEFIPSILSLAKNLVKEGYAIVIITNQSGIARGYFDEATLKKINEQINEQCKAEGLNIDGWYYCPHHPEGIVEPYNIECKCRKPEPGMLLQAAQDLNIDLSRSYMFGDNDCDKEAGLKAGCKAWRIDEEEFKAFLKEKLKS